MITAKVAESTVKQEEIEDHVYRLTLSKIWKSRLLNLLFKTGCGDTHSYFKFIYHHFFLFLTSEESISFSSIRNFNTI
ncbi:hypothetical protein AS29_008020 [Bacillus sp. SJS]|nr:hypothetical protein AS29_008020 [Bacillus sp. SJS]